MKTSSVDNTLLYKTPGPYLLALLYTVQLDLNTARWFCTEAELAESLSVERGWYRSVRRILQLRWSPDKKSPHGIHQAVTHWSPGVNGLMVNTLQQWHAYQKGKSFIGANVLYYCCFDIEKRNKCGTRHIGFFLALVQRLCFQKSSLVSYMIDWLMELIGDEGK